MAQTAAESDADLLTAAVGEAARLLDSDGAMIYLYDEASGELRFAYDAGITSDDARRMLRELRLPIGRGVYGTAIERRELTFTHDYAGRRTLPAPSGGRPDRGNGTHALDGRRADVRGRQAARRAGRFLATARRHSTTSISRCCARWPITRRRRSTTAGCCASCARPRNDCATRPPSWRERSPRGRRLDDIARRIVDVPDSAEVLQEVVDVASGLLGSDGAHLTLMNDDKTILIPMVMAGHTEPPVRSWLRGQRFPVGGGINGLAAQLGEAIWTRDYAERSALAARPGGRRHPAGWSSARSRLRR